MIVYWKCECFVMQIVYVCVHPVAVYCDKSFAHIECYSDCSRRGGGIWLNPFTMLLFSVFIPQLSQKCVKRLHHRLRI